MSRYKSIYTLFRILSIKFWRVTLKSIHPREVKVLPRKILRKLHDIISSIETGVFMGYILDKNAVNQLKEYFNELDYF